MRIALMSTSALSTPPKKYGGTELVVAELAKGLLHLGHEVTVYATGDSGTSGTLRHLYERPVWPPNDLAEGRHSTFAWQDIARDPAGYDVVHVHHAAALPARPNISIATVATVHHFRVDAMVTHYLQYPDVAYVALSDMQAVLMPEIPWAQTIHHGLDPSLYAAGRGGGGYVAFLGRFAAEKAPHLAIDAARSAGVPIRLGGTPQEYPEARAYFDRELRPRLRKRADDVLLCGELAHGPKVRLLQEARALLFPIQWDEPFGLVMIESMLVGTPVIAFARGSAPEVIEEGVTGYVVHTTGQMAERIHQLDRIDRARCRARAQERWSALRMARAYAELYTRVMRRTPRRQLPVLRGRATTGTDHGAQS